MGKDGGGFLSEDEDLAVALRFNVDPYAVNHAWPPELRERALAWMGADAKRRRRDEQRRKARSKR